MKEKKKSNLLNKIMVVVRVIEGVFLLGVLALVLALVLPSSRLHMGYNIKGTIKVTVNDEAAKAENIVCTHNEKVQKVKQKDKGDYVEIKTKSFQYGKSIYDFDVMTPDGLQHFNFGVFKSYMGGPVEEFEYRVELNKVDGEWIAEIFEGNK